VHHIEQQFEHHRAFRAATIGVVLRDALLTRKTAGISCARSYRTLRDGPFGARFPGTSCQATIVLSLRDENSEILCERLLRGAIALLGKPGGRDHLAEGNSAIIRWHPLMPVRPESCCSQ
jgi:hypothetical protein